MAIPQPVIDKILADCGRHCCLCRRFKPLHLQVHHIKHQADGGTDDPDNLIALCLNCHSSVHTKASLARNFTVEELKRHRDQTVTAVRGGRLAGQEETPAAFDKFIERLVGAILPALVKPCPPQVELLSEAIEILVSAARQSCATLLPVQHDGGWALQCGDKQFGGGNSDYRKQATYRRAFEQLVQTGLVDESSANVFVLSHDGYLVADQLVTAQRLRENQAKPT